MSNIQVATFRERLRVPWWAWPTSTALVAFGLLELTLGRALDHPLTYLGAAAATALACLAASRVVVEVDAGPGGGPELRIDDARLPLLVVDSVEVLDAAGRRQLLGPLADPLAFVTYRPWIAGGVRVNLADPQDPTPYWFVSSRHPDQLAAAISAGAGPGASGRDVPPRPVAASPAG